MTITRDHRISRAKCFQIDNRMDLSSRIASLRSSRCKLLFSKLRPRTISTPPMISEKPMGSGNTRHATPSLTSRPPLLYLFIKRALMLLKSLAVLSTQRDTSVRTSATSLRPLWASLKILRFSLLVLSQPPRKALGPLERGQKASYQEDHQKKEEEELLEAHGHLLFAFALR